MSEMAKSARKALKSKAERLVADPQKKVDSSTWTPPEPLNADVKTGMRPVSRRAFKSGGKVTGEANAARADKAPRAYANAKVNRNVKDANEEREGVKHIGGMKSGGRAGKLSGGTIGRYAKEAANEVAWRGPEAARARDKAEKSGRPADQRVADARERKAAQRSRGLDMAISKLSGVTPTIGEKAKIPATRDDDTTMKKGGRIKRQDGGRTETPFYSNSDRQKLMQMIQGIEKGRGESTLKDAELMYDGRKAQPRDFYNAEQMKRLERGYKKGGRVGKMDGGPMGGPDPRLGMVAPTRMKFAGAQGTPYKKGGKVKDKSFDEIREEYGTQVMKKGGKISHMEWEHSKKDLAEDKKLAKKHGMSLEKWEKSKLDEKHDKQQSTKGLKWGGKAEKCEGGSATKRMARKDGGRAKGKTHINIVVNAGKKDGAETPIGAPNPGMPPMARPPVMPVPAPAPGAMPPGLAGAGAPPMGMPPGAGPGGPSMPPPSMMARKTGGRVTKVAKSYKDMEAGAGSGEGRLQKTDIAKRLPKPREDGKNVFDGVGYPNKVPGATGGRTARKAGGGVYRSYKDMDAGAGSGEGRLEKTEIQRSKRGR